MNLSKSVHTALIGSYLTSTGTADDYSQQIDMGGFDGVHCVGIYGTTATSTGTGTFALVGTATSTAASTDYSSISGASVSITASTGGTTGKLVSLDCPQPRYRYLKLKLSRTAGVRWQGTVATKYSPVVQPTTASTSMGATAVLLRFETT